MGRTSFNHAKGGGGTKRFGVVLTQELKMLAILEGVGAIDVHPLKKKRGGGTKSFTLSWGGGAKSLGPTIFPFAGPPPF